MQQRKKVFLSPPHMSGEEIKYIKEAFELNWIAPVGNNIDEFEKELAEYSNVNSVAVLSSGTAAIHLALRLYDVGPGDTVFCSSLTFVASVNPVLYEHATPVLIDSEPETWNMSPEALERALVDAKANNNLPKAVIVVHLYGQSAKMDELMTVCNKYEVPLIEDAAESIGSKYKGIQTGTIGALGIYSFNGNKIITTSGGGALFSNNDEQIEKAKFLATQARDEALHYQHSQIGYNYRMSNIVAGIGRGQLEVLNERVEARRNNFERYKAAFESIEGIHFQTELKDTYSNRWLTAMIIDSEKTGVTSTMMIEKLNEANIESRPIWKPMHLQPLFKDVKYYPHKENESVSDDLFKNGICLPSGSNLTEKEQNNVITIIKNLIYK